VFLLLFYNMGNLGDGIFDLLDPVGLLLGRCRNFSDQTDNLLLAFFNLQKDGVGIGDLPCPIRYRFARILNQIRGCLCSFRRF